MLNNILFNTDSYKVSMWKQYPPGTKHVYSYIEARNDFNGLDKILFFGLQSFIKNYLLKPITAEEVALADQYWTAHGEPFNRAGWDYIVEKHNGYLPIRIQSVEEGLVIPVRNVLVTIVNTDPNVPWLTTWIETPLLRAIWYPSSVATSSWNIKQLISKYLNQSGSPEQIDFKLHDFGARGCSSNETASLGAMSHLVSFKGTDTYVGVLRAMLDYNADITATGFSIPAAEHSTITSWGRASESAAYDNMVHQFAVAGAIFAVVSDSYKYLRSLQNVGNKE